MEDPKKLLREGYFVIIEFLETPQNFSSVRISVADENSVKKITFPFRVPLLANTLAWIVMAQKNIDEIDSRFHLFPNVGAGYPDKTELINHIVRTERFLEKLWPMEAEFVHQCITDERTALMLLTPCPVHGGLFHTEIPLVPAGNLGMVTRHPSPVQYYPHFKQEQESIGLVTSGGQTISIPSNVFANVFGGTPRKQDKNLYDLEFPLPQSNL